MRTLLLLLSLFLLPLSLVAGERGDPGGSVVVTLQGDLPLIAQPSILAPLQRQPTLHEAAELLRRAFRAPERTVVLDLTQGFQPSIAAAESLADTLRRRPQGTRVLCLLEHVNDPALILAAASDEVFCAQAGLLFVGGLALSIDHYTGLLERLGIRFMAVSSGPQKTAPEPLTRKEPSPEALASYQELLQQLDQALVAASLRPDLDEQQLRAARARNPQDGQSAVESGLVHAAVEPGAWLASLPQPLRHLRSGPEQPNLESLAGILSWWGQLMRGRERPAHPEMVAVLQLEGMIVDGDGQLGGGQIPALAVLRLLERLAEDEQIVAVVLRINSGGGSAAASDRIFAALRRLDEKKPVVALLDSMAASGGYYIALGGREIVAHSSSITGSIGVFAMLPDLSGSRDLLGIHRSTLRTDARADLLSTNAISEERRQGILQVVKSMDHTFRSLVAQRRSMSQERIDDLADGRIFTGAQAVENGLIDALGSLPEAVARARQAAGIDYPLPLDIYPQEQGLSALLGLGPASLLPSQLSALLGQDPQYPHPRLLMWWGGVELR